MCRTKNFIYCIGRILAITFLIICLTAVLNPGTPTAQPKVWKPDGPMTIINDAVGGAYELTARQIAQVLPELLGQKVIIQAMTGGVGGNALDFVAKSKPDGRTMNLQGLGVYIAMSVRKQYYSWDIKDLPIVMAIDAPPYGLFASAKSPYYSYGDLSKQKRVVRIAIAGGNFSILPLFLDFNKRGIQYIGVRFKGSADAFLAIYGGDADLTMVAASGTTMDQIKAGDCRTLCVFDTKRFSLLPNAPTIVELGMPEESAKYRLMRLMQVAPGTPEHIQKRLKEALTEALKDKRTVEWSKKTDVPVDIVPEEECMGRIHYTVQGFKEHWKMMEPFF